jgi:hypothetical protein
VSPRTAAPRLRPKGGAAAPAAVGAAETVAATASRPQNRSSPSPVSRPLYIAGRGRRSARRVAGRSDTVLALESA